VPALTLLRIFSSRPLLLTSARSWNVLPPLTTTSSARSRSLSGDRKLRTSNSFEVISSQGVPTTAYGTKNAFFLPPVISRIAGM
jgi:hypothetical protein